MKQRITNHLLARNSYFKWGSERLAAKFGCSPRTINSIIKSLENEKRTYLNSFKNN